MDSGILWFFNKTRLIVSLQGLSHHQFLGHHGTVLLNDIDEIDALVPVGGIDVDDLAALLFADLLADEVIDLHLGHIRAFHGESIIGGIRINNIAFRLKLCFFYSIPITAKNR